MKLLFILLIIILINNNIIINALKPANDPEYEALKDIVSSVVSSKDFDLIYTSTPTDLCAVQNYTYLNVRCKTIDSKEYYDYIKVSSTGVVYTFGYDPFYKFVQLSYLELNIPDNTAASSDTFGDDDSTDKNRGVAQSLYLNIKLKDLKVIPLPTTSLTLNLLSEHPPVFNFSILRNILDFNYVNLKISPPFYNNNMISSSTIKNMNTFYFTTSNIPSFESISVKDLQMKLIDGFDRNSIGNLSTFGLSDSINIDFGSTLIDFPTLQLEKTTQLYIKGQFNAPANQVDLIACTGLKKLSISSSVVFNFIGQIPLKNFAPSLTYLSLPNIGLSVSPDISSTNIQDLKLNNNQLTTVPESFCQLNIQTLDLSNNIGLTTPLPNCFRCYKRTLANYYKTAFAGATNIINWVNSNTIDNQACGSIQPKLNYNSITNEIQLSGTNLGFINPVAKYSDPNGIEQTIQFSVVKYSSLFTAKWTNNYKLPDILTIAFDGDDYMVGSAGQAPLIQKVLKLDSSTFNFSGLYFGYSISNTSVTFIPYNGDPNGIFGNQQNEIQCQVTSVSFDSIECEIDSGNELDPDIALYVVVVKVDELSSQITIDPTIDTEQIIIPCENSCQNGGVCISTSGECQCTDQYLGDDCSIVKCPNDCGGVDHGKCNETNGVCECYQFYIKEDCGTPNHTATRFSTPTTTGGDIIIDGWFGDIHENLTITIGNDPCSVNQVNLTFINCTTTPHLAGFYNVNITQNNIEWFRENRLEFLDTVKYKENSSWILPVSIVIPCVVIVICNIIGIVYVYKRQRINLFFEKRKKRVVSLEEFN